MSTKLSIVAAAVVFMLLGINCYSCVTEEPKKESARVDNIVRIFMHEPGDYTFWVQDSESVDVKSVRVDTRHRGDAKVVTDVSADQKAWARYNVFTSSMNGSYTRDLEIHLHHVDEVNGSGWDHGKNGRGTTVPIE